LATALLSCAGEDGNRAVDERVTALEAKARSLERSIEALADENAELKSQIAILEGQTGSVARHQEESSIDAVVRLDDLDTRVQELERVASGVEPDLPATEQRPKGKEGKPSQPEGSALEKTVRLVEDSGGTVHYIDHPQRDDRSVLVMPRETVDGRTPLIVSLHGFGGDSAQHSTYVPLHERVNTHGFALLLPNGIRDSGGNRFWNPTDECCESAKGGQEDVAYLTELVARAEQVMDFGPVYFFGYSNGGFMAYHIACKGLPGLRAVASLAGTSYVQDARCDGAAPVSVLHIHGTADDVIRFEGDVSEPDPGDDGEPAFYAGALEMVNRWSRRAGCEGPEQPQPYATLDLDHQVAGPETRALRLDSGCAEGIRIELWMSVGSSHAPGYGDTFVDALVDWLLSQE